MQETKYRINGRTLSIGLPLVKVDVERRIVYGFATLDNLDNQGDVIPLDASLVAFERFGGNIREQHDPTKAVGRMISFSPETMYDDETGKTYKGIFVSVFVSRGAEDTWLKVLDGTLRGFSIGGVVINAREAFDAELGQRVSIIHEYELQELSLVDSPGNPLATIVLAKAATGSSQVADVETIYVCIEDGTVVTSAAEVAACPTCDGPVSNAGFVEANDMKKAGTIDSVLKKFFGKSKDKEANIMDITKSGTAVLDAPADTQADAPVNVPVDAPVDVQVDTAVDAAVDTVETPVDASEQPPVTVDESLESAVEEAFTEVSEEEPAAEASDSVEAEKSDDVDEPVNEGVKTDSILEVLVEMVGSVNNVLTALTTRIDGVEATLSDRIGTVKSDLDEEIKKFGERIEKAEKATAFRKSGDLGEVAQERATEEPASLWGGRFLTVSEL